MPIFHRKPHKVQASLCVLLIGGLSACSIIDGLSPKTEATGLDGGVTQPKDASSDASDSGEHPDAYTDPVDSGVHPDADSLHTHLECTFPEELSNGQPPIKDHGVWWQPKRFYRVGERFTILAYEFAFNNGCQFTADSNAPETAFSDYIHAMAVNKAGHVYVATDKSPSGAVGLVGNGEIKSECSIGVNGLSASFRAPSEKKLLGYLPDAIHLFDFDETTETCNSTQLDTSWKPPNTEITAASFGELGEKIYVALKPTSGGLSHIVEVNVFNQQATGREYGNKMDETADDALWTISQLSACGEALCALDSDGRAVHFIYLTGGSTKFDIEKEIGLAANLTYPVAFHGESPESGFLSLYVYDEADDIYEAHVYLIRLQFD